MRFIVLQVFALVFLCLSFAFGYSIYLHLNFSISSLGAFRFEGLGMLIYLVVFCVLKLMHKNFEFAETFCHELNHAIFCMLSFRKVDSFFADSEKGGKVSFSGKPNPLIVLAPYVFPLFAAVIFFVKQFAVPKTFSIIDAFIGFFLFFHLHSVLSEAHPRQTDLKIYGFLFSYSVIILINIILLPFIFIATGEGFDSGVDFLKNAWQVILQFVLKILELR